MLTIEPTGGLCNRLRTIDSAVALGQEIEKPVHIIWNINNRFGCSFPRLFEVPAEISSIRDKTPGPLPISKIDVCRLLDLRRPRSNCNNHDIQQLHRAGFDFRSLRSRSRLHFKTLDRFFDPYGIKHLFVPTAKLQDAVADRCAEFDGCVGVHIRRTDHRPSKYSPTSQFIEKMRTELETSDCEMFFLATDDESEEHEMRKHFGNRIITYAKRNRARDNVEGIEDAVIDLFCLSRTNKIVGTAFSSFTKMAAEIGGIQYEIATEGLPDINDVVW